MYKNFSKSKYRESTSTDTQMGQMTQMIDQKQEKYYNIVMENLKKSEISSGWLELSQASFSFWDNSEDGIYDEL